MTENVDLKSRPPKPLPPSDMLLAPVIMLAVVSLSERPSWERIICVILSFLFFLYQWFQSKRRQSIAYVEYLLYLTYRELEYRKKQNEISDDVRKRLSKYNLPISDTSPDEQNIVKKIEYLKAKRQELLDCWWIISVDFNQ